MKEQFELIYKKLEKSIKMLYESNESNEDVYHILKDVYYDNLPIVVKKIREQTKMLNKKMHVFNKNDILFLCDLLRLKASCDDDNSLALMHKYLSNFEIKYYCANLIKKLKGLI